MDSAGSDHLVETTVLGARPDDELTQPGPTYCTWARATYPQLLPVVCWAGHR